MGGPHFVELFIHQWKPQTSYLKNFLYWNNCTFTRSCKKCTDRSVSFYHISPISLTWVTYHIMLQFQNQVTYVNVIYRPYSDVNSLSLFTSMCLSYLFMQGFFTCIDFCNHHKNDKSSVSLFLKRNFVRTLPWMESGYERLEDKLTLK